MKKSHIISLVVVCIVLIGAFVGVLIYNNSTAEPSENESQATIKFSDIDTEDIVSLTFREKGEEYTFKKGDEWTLTGEADFEVDQEKIDAIISAMHPLMAVREIDAAESLASYGLEDPAASISASDSKGNTVDLEIGKKNGEYYFAKESGKNTIYTIEAALPEALDLEFIDLFKAETILNTLKKATMEKIDFTIGGSTFSVEKETVSGEDGKDTYNWYMVSEDGARTLVSDIPVTISENYTSQRLYTVLSSQEYWDNVLDSLYNLQVINPTEYKPEDLSKYGLDDPFLTLNVKKTSSGDGDYTDLAISFGSLTTDEFDDEYYYAYKQDSQVVYMVSRATVDTIAESLDALMADY